MKALRILLSILFIFFISYSAAAQDINVHSLIGKKKSEVIKRFGNPVHQDNSNPSMICMFYKGASYTLTFVSNESGVFQAEAAASYNSLEQAKKALDEMISESVKEQYQVDSVTVKDFRLRKPGVKVDLQMEENKLSGKFDIRVKAVKTSS